MYRAVYHRLGSLADHSPGQIGLTAERLLIDKISPAADALSNQKAQYCNIQYRRNP